MSDKTPDVICMARLEVLDAANMSVEDAVEIMGRIERMSSELGVELCKWVEFGGRAK